MDLDLSLAFRKLRQLQLEDGDLGAEYWLAVEKYLREAEAFKHRALVAERKLAQIQRKPGQGGG